MLMRLAAIAAIATVTAADASAQRQFPDLSALRTLIATHQPRLAAGDSGINASIIVIDTNAKYVRSVAFRLSDAEFAALDPVGHAVVLQDDSTAHAILDACVHSAAERR